MAKKPVTKLYRIVNDTFGKYRTEARANAVGSVWVAFGSTYETFASARQAIRNAAIHDEHARAFTPGVWTFTEAQATKVNSDQPARMDL
jgi:hypothetical protein